MSWKRLKLTIIVKIWSVAYTTTSIEGRIGNASLREIMATFESQLMLKRSSSRLVCFIRICLCYDSDPLHNLSSIMVPTGTCQWNGGLAARWLLTMDVIILQVIYYGIDVLCESFLRLLSSGTTDHDLTIAALVGVRVRQCDVESQTETRRAHWYLTKSNKMIRAVQLLPSRLSAPWIPE